MGGMPSCRGLEWKGVPGGGSRANFDKGFDAIPKDAAGKFIEPKSEPLEAPVKPIPASCSDCFFVVGCKTETAHGSATCRERLGV
jgi:hypothetical protein